MQTEKRGKIGGSKKLIVALLILAILFSAFSIIISMTISNFEIPQFRRPVSGEASSSGVGGIGFVVESSSGGQG